MSGLNFFPQNLHGTSFSVDVFQMMFNVTNELLALRTFGFVVFKFVTFEVLQTLCTEAADVARITFVSVDLFHVILEASNRSMADRTLRSFVSDFMVLKISKNICFIIASVA